MADPVFYPSVVVNMTLRFDDAFNVNTTPPAVTPTALALQQAGLASLPGFNDVVQGAKTTEPLFSQPSLTSLPIIGSFINQQKELSTLVNRIPKSASIELPGFRQAGKFNLTFDFRDIPVDPRLLRSVAVKVYMGTVSESDFSTGMLKYDSKGGRLSVLKPNDSDSSKNNLMLAGLVDTWSVTHSERGSEIHMEGRDNRGWLLDSPIDPLLEPSLDLTHPIDDVVVQILKKHPQGQFINVVTFADDWLGDDAFGPLQLPSPATDTKTTRQKKGADGKNPGATPPGTSSSISYWGLITQYCQLVGACPTFKNNDLIIRPFRSLWDQQYGGLSPDVVTPFQDGEPRNVKTGAAGQETTNPIRIRKFIFGRDIQSMTFERKYTTGIPSAVLCLSVDPDKGKGKDKLVWGQWPSVAAAAQRALDLGRITKKQFNAAIEQSKKSVVSPSGQEVSNNILRIPVPGVKDKSALEEIARAIFEEVKRGEMGGSVQTKNLASFGGKNVEPDLLNLRPGDAVELLVDQRALNSQSPAVSPLNNLARMPFSEAVKELKARIGDGSPVSEDIARAIVASAQGSVVELQTFFRVNNVKYNWDANSGMAVAFDFQNYIEARSLTAPPSTGQNSANTPNKKKGTRPKTVKSTGKRTA